MEFCSDIYCGFWNVLSSFIATMKKSYTVRMSMQNTYWELWKGLFFKEKNKDK